MNYAAIRYPVLVPAFELPRPRGDWRVGAAVLASLVVHGLALGWLPGLHGRAHEPAAQTPIHVRIATLPPEPQSLAAPPALTSGPVAQPALREPVPVPQPITSVLTSAVPEAAQDAVVPRRIEPVAADPGETARPSPVPARPAALDAAALAAYGRDLAGAVATHQRYPRVALLRQWQGTAVLQLELAADGRLLGVRVASSSGHDTLDRQALDMVRAALPLPAMPAALVGRPLVVDVPVVFRISA
jgi:protein TonB